jgi:hypothetical protein
MEEAQQRRRETGILAPAILTDGERCVVEKRWMLFGQSNDRFKKGNDPKTVGFVAPTSELSKKGIKIIDSWVPRESGERLPQNLALRDGFLIPIESMFSFPFIILTIVDRSKPSGHLSIQSTLRGNLSETNMPKMV